VAQRTILLLDTTLDDNPTSAAAAYDFNGISPKKITFLVQITKTSTPTSVALTVELSGDKGANLITYDKLLTDAGSDAPVSSVSYNATADDIVSLSPEDAIDYINVTLTGTGTTAANTFACKVWMTYAY